MTLDELKKRDEEREGQPANQRFYAGGEKSGMYVEGGGEDVKRAVEGVFGKARAGNQSREEAAAPPFRGRARKISASDEDHHADEQNEGMEHGEQVVVARNVIFWQDGLSIEDGPLRPYSDPGTARLLDQLNNGQAPLKEFGVSPGQSVDVKVAHCLGQAFSKEERDKELRAMHGEAEEPKRTFTGASHKLSEANGEATKGKERVDEKPGDRLRFDPSKPSTRLQLRLSNGTKVVETVNVGVTVGELLRHMQALNPSNYTGVIMSGMPPQPITLGHEATLEAAGLLNAIVIQK